jgi:hypothetical protein
MRYMVIFVKMMAEAVEADEADEADEARGEGA